MKQNRKKRILAMILLVFLAALSLSPEAVQAERENSGEIQARLCTLSGEAMETMKFGRFACLEFALPQDLEVKIELCLPNYGEPLGCLYGVFYGEHLKNQGSRGMPDYEWKRQMEEEELRSGLETLSLRGFYEKTERLFGTGHPFSNYLVWKGQYVPRGESYPRYIKPGSYELRIMPLDTSFRSQEVRIPLTVRGGGEEGILTEEDVQAVLDREESAFPLEHMHVLDTLAEHRNCRVDLRTGELLWQDLDIRTDEEGGLPFARFHHAGQYYNDQGLNIAGLGDLWTHSYSYFADIYRMDIDIYLPKGEILNFQKVYRKGWQCFGDRPYTLEEGEEGFILRTPEGDKITFNDSGQASRILKADGRELRLSYVSDRLVQVFSDTDRLFFSYDKERLVKVTSDLGAKVEFCYQGESGNVAESLPEDGTSTRYEYDEKGQLGKVWRGAGDLEMEVSYGEYSNITGRAKAELLRLPKEDLQLTFSYEDSEKMNICRKKGGGALALAYGENYSSEYANGTWMLFDKDGQLMRSSDPTGKTTVY